MLSVEANKAGPLYEDSIYFRHLRLVLTRPSACPIPSRPTSSEVTEASPSTQWDKYTTLFLPADFSHKKTLW